MTYWTTEALEKEIGELEASLAHKRLLLEQLEEEARIEPVEAPPRPRPVVPVFEGVSDSAASSEYIVR